MTSKKNTVKKQEIAKLQELEKQISSLPEEQKLMLLQKETVAEYSGVLPPPSMLKQFDEVIPNGAERIMAMAEKEANERQSNNRKMINYNSTGMYLAFILAVTLFTFSFLLAWKGNNPGATVLAGVGLTGIVTTFVTGKDNKK